MLSLQSRRTCTYFTASLIGRVFQQPWSWSEHSEAPDPERGGPQATSRSGRAKSAVQRFEKSLGAIRALAHVPSPEDVTAAPPSSFLEGEGSGQSLLEQALAGDVRRRLRSPISGN